MKGKQVIKSRMVLTLLNSIPVSAAVKLCAGFDLVISNGRISEVIKSV